MKRLFGMLVVALALCCCCLAVGCSSGSSTSTSAASSIAASTSASSASFTATAASASGGSAASADAATSDFDRAVVGTWHVYEAEFAHKHDGGSDKWDAQTIALLRKYGLHSTITVFSDGTFNTSDGVKGTWVQKDRNVLALTFGDDEEPADLTLQNNRLTLDAGKDLGKVVYARG